MDTLLDPTVAVIGRYTQDVPVQVDHIARDLGLVVRLDTTLGSEVAGKIVKDNSGSPSGYVIYLNASDGPRRQRFTLAHEIAHFALHKHLIGDGLVDNALYRSKLSAWYERQANRMAADILMPAGLVRGLFKGGMRGMSQLANTLDVSEQAIRIRCEELGLGA